MQRLAVSLSVLSLVVSLAGGSALSQTTGTDKATQKMKTSEDPSSPAMQAQAAKQAECKKQAKAKNLKGSKRRAFIKDCAK